jgi:hypothetical protein
MLALSAALAAPCFAQDGNPLGAKEPPAAAKAGNPLGNDPAAPAPDPLVATFSGAKFTLRLNADGAGKYRGVLKIGNDQMLATATGDPGALRGTFISDGKEYEFAASLSGKTMTFSTGGATYDLASDGPAAPATPPAPKPDADKPDLVKPGPAAVVVGGGDGNADNLGVVKATKTGRALFESRQGAKSAKALLTSAAADLGAYIKAKPALTGAFADAKDLRAGAAFTATVEGQAIRGMILAGVGDRGGAVTIVYDAADAPPKALAALAGAVPAPVKWEDARLPDGSGSLKMPTGWRITGAAKGAVDVVGPEGQNVELGLAYPVNTPQVEQAWLAQQAQIGMRPRPSGVPVAPFPRSAAQAVEVMAPNLNRASVAAGGNTLEIVRADEIAPVQNAAGVGGMLHIVGDSVDRQGRRTRLRSMAYVLASAIGDGRWLYYVSYASAPESTFERDLPVMGQIWASWKVDDRVLRDRLAKASESLRQANEIQARGRIDAQKVRDNANADFDEMIRGYRTVEDTQTGER